MTTQDDKPLTGIRVIEFSQMVAARPPAPVVMATATLE